MRRNIAIDEQKLLLDKIKELSYLLGDITIDEAKTVLGSEPYLKPLLDEKNREEVTEKLMELIRKI